MDPRRFILDPSRPVLLSAPLPEYSQTPVPHWVAMDENKWLRAAEN
jgi:hypothetical protein